MGTNQANILAINPGSRHMGIAVFCEMELREWSIKILHKVTSKEKEELAIEIIQEMIRLYCINKVVIKKLHPSRSSSNLEHILSALKKCILKSSIELCEYSLDAVENFLITSQRKNKTNIMQEVVTRYPFLNHELEMERRNKNHYFIRMFEAVALGITCLNRLEKEDVKVVVKH